MYSSEFTLQISPHSPFPPCTDQEKPRRLARSERGERARRSGQRAEPTLTRGREPIGVAPPPSHDDGPRARRLCCGTRALR